MRLKLFLAFFAIYVIWGTTPLAIHFVIESFPPFYAAGLRYLVAGVILMVVSSFMTKEKIKPIYWRSALIVGFLMLGANGLVFWGQLYIGSGLSSLLIATLPLWTVLYSWVRSKEVPSKRLFLGLAVGFFGVTMIFSEGILANATSSIIFASLLTICAALFWSIGTIEQKHVSLPEHSYLSTGMIMVCGGVGLLGIGGVTGETFEMTMLENTSSVLAFFYLLFFGALMGFSSYSW